MIQPLQSHSISLKGAELSPALKARIEAQNNQQKAVAVDEQPKKKFSVSEAYQNVKKGIVGFFKGVNNVTNVASGVTRGIAEGAAATAVVGVAGKAIKGAKDSQGLKVISDIAVSTVKDFAIGAWETIKFIPSILTKSPIDNIKTVSSLPKKFYGTYLKNNKTVAIVATAVGLGVLAFRTIQGKVNANEKNADLEHKTNLGHVKS